MNCGKFISIAHQQPCKNASPERLAAALQCLAHSRCFDGSQALRQAFSETSLNSLAFSRVFELRVTGIGRQPACQSSLK